MGNFTYIPAEVPGACSMNKNIHALVDGKQKNLSWWKEGAFFKYPYILVSAHYGLEYPNLRENLGVGNDFILIGDSGGFQNMSLKEWQGKDIFIDPKQVFEWQKRNCDVGFPLDYPPFADSEEAWQKSLRISKENFAIAEERYAKEFSVPTGIPGEVDKNGDRPFFLYNVFQGYGYDRKRMDEWYEMATQYPNMSATGWAFGCKPEAKPMLIAYQAMYMYEKGHKKNFHFLAVSGSKTIPVMAYLARYIDNITSDSSGWAQGSMQRKYFLPMYFGKYELFFGQHNKAEVKSLPCNCPVCSNITYIEQLSAGGSSPGGLISLHNLYQIIMFSQLCNSMKEDKDVYKAFVKKMFKGEVLASIEFIDYCLEVGFDKACVKFAKWFTIKSSKKETTGLLEY